MAANQSPVFPATQNVGFGTLLNADTSYTVPITAGVCIFTAGPNGSRIDGMKIRALGTNAATVLRIFLNDGMGTAASDFALVHEVQLAATTAASAAITGVDTELFPINFDNMGGSTQAGTGVLPPFLKPGQKIYVSLGAAVAAGYSVSVFGGDY